MQVKAVLQLLNCILRTRGLFNDLQKMARFTYGFLTRGFHPLNVAPANPRATRDPPMTRAGEGSPELLLLAKLPKCIP